MSESEKCPGTPIQMNSKGYGEMMDDLRRQLATSQARERAFAEALDTIAKATGVLDMTGSPEGRARMLAKWVPERLAAAQARAEKAEEFAQGLLATYDQYVHDDGDGKLHIDSICQQIAALSAKEAKR